MSADFYAKSIYSLKTLVIEGADRFCAVLKREEPDGTIRLEFLPADAVGVCDYEEVRYSCADNREVGRKRHPPVAVLLQHWWDLGFVPFNEFDTQYVGECKAIDCQREVAASLLTESDFRRVVWSDQTPKS